MIVCGDLYIDKGNINKIDFNLCFKDLHEVLERNEFRVINLEAPILIENKGYKKNPKIGPNLGMNEDIINLIKDRFNICTLANNHIMDYCVNGVIDTIEYLDKSDINYVGIKTRKYDLYSKIINCKNKSVAIINIAENEFLKDPDSDEVLVSNYDCINNYYEILTLREKVDFVVCIYHGGNEHINLPSPELVKRTKYLIDIGCNVVICHHSHITSGYLKYNDGNIFFGLGNFIFDSEPQKLEYWYKGLMVEIDFSDNLRFNVIPIRYEPKEKKLYLLKDEEKNIWLKDYQRMNLIIQDEALLEKEFEKLIDKKLIKYRGFLEVIGNKYYQKLAKYNIVPSVFRGNKILLYENLIRCETHRENVIKFLTKNKL